MKISKAIAITACSLAVLSVTSVGFATWLVGVQQKSQDVTMNLTVDTIENNTYFLSASLSSSSIQIGESKVVEKSEGDDVLGVGDNSNPAIANAMKFSFDNISLKLAKNKNISSSKPEKVKVDLVKVTDGSTEIDFNKVSKGGNRLGEKEEGVKYRPDVENGWTYLAYSKELTIGTDLILDADAEDVDTYETYVLKDGTLDCTLEWGDFFGNSLPSTYYNNLFEGETDVDKLTTGTMNVATELSEMSTALSGKTITLQVSVVEGSEA